MKTSITRKVLLQRAGIGVELHATSKEPAPKAAPKLTLKAKHVPLLTAERKERLAAAARNPKSKHRQFPVIILD